MKTTFFLLLVLVHGIASAGPSAAQPHKDDNECLYVGKNGECLNKAKCEAKGGLWGGTVSGRGRTPGCNLPTSDAGKPCTNDSQCQGSCVPKERMTPPCVCDRWMSQPKGFQMWCTDKGVQALEVD